MDESHQDQEHAKAREQRPYVEEAVQQAGQRSVEHKCEQQSDTQRDQLGEVAGEPTAQAVVDESAQHRHNGDIQQIQTQRPARV